jgi:hypothetical protein
MYNDKAGEHAGLRGGFVGRYILIWSTDPEGVGFFLTLSGSFCRERLSSIVLSQKPVPPLFREISGNLLTNTACGCII